MIRRFWINIGRSCLILLAAAGSLAAAEPTCSPPPTGNFVAYTIHWHHGESASALDVRLTFRLGGRSGVDLVTPSTWQGVAGLDESIRNLRVRSAATTLRAGDEHPGTRITFARGTTVSLEYVYEPGSASSKGFPGPVLNPSYFVLPGRTFLAYPDIDEHEHIPVSVEWTGFPPEWTVGDNLDVSGYCHRSNELLKLSNGIFIGGNFRLTRIPVDGGSVYLAARGDWKFKDEEFASRIAKIVQEERQFWREPSQGQYLIVLTPIDGPPGKYAGIAVEDAVLVRMSQGTNIGFDTDFLLAHEIFHTWNPAQLGELSRDSLYWFIEGFTDYFAGKFLLHAGLITPEQYVEVINASYSEYVSSPSRNYPKELILSEYFSNADAQRLPYLQGTFLALKWNALIRDRSRGKDNLDDAMRSLRQSARQSEQTLTNEYLTKFFGEFAGKEVSSDISAYVGLGQTIPLPAGGLGNCVHTSQRQIFVFDAGFDIDSMYRTRVIRHVNATSTAYQAGLRDGQVVVRSTVINPNDPNQPVDIDVEEPAGRKTVSYLPRAPLALVDQFQRTVPPGSDGCELSY